MSLRTSLSVLAILAATLATACASDGSLREAASAACTDEGVQPGPAMEECIQDTEEALRRAREQRPEPPPPPPGAQHHGAAQHHG
jgi:hypothetical protein